MSDLFRIIGAVIFSIVMYAIPILATCSFTFHWSDEAQFLLTILCIMQFIYITLKNIKRED